MEEVGGPLGLALWGALRDVTLWSQCPPAERPGLFMPGTGTTRLAEVMSLGAEPRLEGLLRELAQVAATDPQPADQAISLACRGVAQWAEEKAHLATAVSFAQAAALVCPADQLAAFTVGRLARISADHARAEVWYRRTIGLARDARDWRAYTEAFFGLGNLYMRRGNIPEARRLRVRALRGARRGGMRRLQAIALHGLFEVETSCGNQEAAENYARRAFEAYGPKSKQLPILANDVASFWIDQGLFERAARILKPLLGQLLTPDLKWLRILLLANTARAAGGTGDGPTFRAAAAEAEREAEDPTRVDFAARVYVEVARGAASLTLWSVAEEFAERALEIAKARAEAKTRFEAEAVLDHVRRREQAMVRRTTGGLEAAEGDQFAQEFAEALEVGAP